MCAACTDSAVTGRDACTGRLVRMCTACTDSAVLVVICLLVAMCECAFAYQCLGVLYPCGVRGCPCINYMSPLKSASTARMPPRPNVNGSSRSWWCTLRN